MSESSEVAATAVAGTSTPIASSAPPPQTTISSILSLDLLSSSVGAASASTAHMARLQSHFANLAPSCSAHLSDQNAIPIISTSANPSSPALSSLSAAFVQAHDTASRMGLGKPLRVTLSTGTGAAVIQTGTLPETDDGDEATAIAGGAAHSNGENMMLVGTVIAPVDRLAEARIASWGVEDVARKFQKYMHEGK